MDKVASAINLMVGAIAQVIYSPVAKDATLATGAGCLITRAVVLAIGAGDLVAIMTF